MLGRVRSFGEKRRELFPESTVAGEAFAAVAESVTQLKQYAEDQMSRAKEGRRAKAAARRALVEALEEIARTARLIGRRTPEFDDPFSLPRPRSDQTVLAAGRVFAREAERVKPKFLAHGLADTFIADLTAVADAFEKAISGTERGKSELTEAKAGIATAMACGLGAARTLDVIVTNQLKKDSKAIAAWERARRIGHPRSKSPAAPASEPETPPAVPEAA
jgi:hypothetical protein